MDALTGQRVQIDGERRDQRFALAGLHLGYLAAVEGNAADQLDVVVALAKRAHRRLADRGESLGKQIVELGAVRQPLAEQDGVVPEFLVSQRADRRLEGVRRLDDLAERTDIAVVRRSEDGLGQCGDHAISQSVERALSPPDERSKPSMANVAGDVGLGLWQVN